MNSIAELPHITENMIVEEYLAKRQAWIQAYKKETKDAEDYLHALREEIDRAFWGRKKVNDWLNPESETTPIGRVPTLIDKSEPSPISLVSEYTSSDKASIMPPIYESPAESVGQVEVPASKDQGVQTTSRVRFASPDSEPKLEKSPDEDIFTSPSKASSKAKAEYSLLFKSPANADQRKSLLPSSSDVPAGMSAKELLSHQVRLSKEGRKYGFAVVEQAEIDNLDMENTSLKADIRKYMIENAGLVKENEELIHRNNTYRLRITQLLDTNSRVVEDTRDMIREAKGKEVDEEAYVKKRRHQDGSPVGETTLTEDISMEEDSPMPTAGSELEPWQVIELLKIMTVRLADRRRTEPAQSRTEPNALTKDLLYVQNTLAEQLRTLNSAISDLQDEVVEAEDILENGSEWSRAV